MLTCIISQFDCKEGTKGLAFCIGAGKIKVAKLLTIKLTGTIIAPIIFVFVFVSIKIKINNTHQSKNRSDSYKLLSGKYPDVNQRNAKVVNNKKLLEIIPNHDKFLNS
jgi:hypothetical protein